MTESPITVPQTGVRKFTEICEKNCAAASMTVLAAEAAAAFPIAAITPANTGTNTSMNSEAAESTSSVSRSAPDIAAVVIPAPARTPTAENTPDMFPPAPSAELRESAQVYHHAAQRREQPQRLGEPVHQHVPQEFQHSAERQSRRTVVVGGYPAALQYLGGLRRNCVG